MSSWRITDSDGRTFVYLTGEATEDEARKSYEASSGNTVVSIEDDDVVFERWYLATHGRYPDWMQIQAEGKRIVAEAMRRM